MLDAAHVLVHGQPGIHRIPAERQLVVGGVAVAQEVPAGAHEGVHGVRFAPGRFAAAGASHLHPALQLGQRGGPLAGEGHIPRQLNRQLFRRHGHGATAVAVDHGDRTAPVALTGDQPIAQAELHPLPPPAFGLSGGGDGRLGLGGGEAVKTARMDQHPGFGPGTPLKGVFIAALGNDHLLHRQLVLAGEQEIPLVVGRHPHHGTGAVVRQHVVGDPDRHQCAVGGVAHLGANRHTALGLVFGGAVLLALPRHQIAKGLHRQPLRGAGERRHQGMLRGQHHIGGAENGVRPCGEHGDLLTGVGAVVVDHRKLQLRTGAAADPVGLHGAHPLRPPLQAVEVVQQRLGVIGDLQKPLAQLPLFHQCPGSPGTPVTVHLFIGEHGLVDGIPVDRGFLAIGQARFEELQEQPLGPAVVIAVAGGHLPLPVDRQPQLVQLAAHGGDVLVGPDAGIHPPFDGGVLGGQAEGIPPHGVKHLAAPQPLHPGHHIGDDVIAHMAHVQVPGGVREHRQGIEALLTGFQFRGVVQPLLLPGPLPVRLNRLGLVAAGVAHGWQNGVPLMLPQPQV